MLIDDFNNDSVTNIANYYTGQNRALRELGTNGNPQTLASTTGLHGSSKTSAFITKNGATVFINRDTSSIARKKDIKESEVTDAGGSLLKVAGDVIIDVNGLKEPNTIGRDVFAFILGADGNLYPYGSIDVSAYANGSNANVWNKENGTYSCVDSKIKNGGLGCTARLIENNYEFNY